MQTSLAGRRVRAAGVAGVLIAGLGVSVPAIASAATPPAGTFTVIPDGYGASYNEGPTTALPDLVGDMVLNT